MGLQDTTSVHICSKNNNIKNAHGKDPMEEIMLQIGLSSSQAGKQRFLVNLQFTTLHFEHSLRDTSSLDYVNTSYNATKPIGLKVQTIGGLPQWTNN